MTSLGSFNFALPAASTAAAAPSFSFSSSSFPSTSTSSSSSSAAAAAAAAPSSFSSSSSSSSSLSAPLSTPSRPPSSSLFSSNSSSQRSNSKTKSLLSQSQQQQQPTTGGGFSFGTATGGGGGGGSGGFGGFGGGSSNGFSFSSDLSSRTSNPGLSTNVSTHLVRPTQPVTSSSSSTLFNNNTNNSQPSSATKGYLTTLSSSVAAPSASSASALALSQMTSEYSTTDPFVSSLLSHPIFLSLQQSSRHSTSTSSTSTSTTSSAPRSFLPSSRIAVSMQNQLYVLSDPSPSADEKQPTQSLSFIDLTALKRNPKQTQVKQIETSPPLPSSSSPPFFHSILINSTSTYALLYHDFSLSLVSLPRSPLESILTSRSSTTTLRCLRRPLASSLFSSPSLRLRSAAFHPLSDSHVCVLTNDNKFRVFAVEKSCEVAEQEWDLEREEKEVERRRREKRRERGEEEQEKERNKKVEYIDFAFGPACVWDLFSIYFLTRDGRIGALCPVVPYGCSLPLQVIKELIQTETEQIQDEAAVGGGEEEEEDNEENDFVSNGREVEKRLQWLRRTWFHEGENEWNCKKPYPIARKQTGVQAVIARMQPPINVGPSVDEQQSFSSSTSSPTAVSLCILRSTPSPPVRFFRVFSSGRVDVILGINGIVPVFTSSPLLSSLTVLSSCLLAADTIDVQWTPANQMKVKMITDPYDANIAWLQSNNSVYVIRCDWIDEITQVLTEQQQSSSSSLSATIDSIISRSNTEFRSLHSHTSLSTHLLASSLLSDPILGRFIVMYDDKCHTIDVQQIEKFKTVQLVTEMKRQQEETEAREGGEEEKEEFEKAARKFGGAVADIEPFSSVISDFVTKYSNFHPNLSLPSSLSPIHLSSVPALHTFLSIRKHFTSIFTDCATLQLAIVSRLELLSTLTMKQEEWMREVEEKIRGCKTDNERLKNQVEMHVELQKELKEKGESVQKEWNTSGVLGEMRLSEAEKEWQRELREKEEEVKRFQLKMQELKEKVAEVRARQEAQQRLREKMMDVNGGSSAEAEARVMKFQPLIEEHREAIQALIKEVKALKAQANGTEQGATQLLLKQ